MGHHIMKWAKLNLSHAIMTDMSLNIRVIMACDEFQLGPFDYVATHIYVKLVKNFVGIDMLNKSIQ